MVLPSGIPAEHTLPRHHRSPAAADLPPQRAKACSTCRACSIVSSPFSRPWAFNFPKLAAAREYRRHALWDRSETGHYSRLRRSRMSHRKSTTAAAERPRLPQ